MPGEFFDAMGQIASYAVEAEHAITDTQFPTKEIDSHQFRINCNGHILFVTGQPQRREFHLNYPVRISNYIRADVTESQIHDVQTADPSLSDQEAVEEVVRQRLASLDQSVVNDANDAMLDAIDDTEIRVTSYETEDGHWDGRGANISLFPYREDWGLREYRQAVQKTVTTASEMFEAAAEHIDLLTTDQEPQTQQRDFESGRGFN